MHKYFFDEEIIELGLFCAETDGRQAAGVAHAHHTAV
jgi:hypothetical protein